MTISASHVVFLVGVSLFAESYALADDPNAEPLSVQVLPTSRTPVHVWPIMRGCMPDKQATTAVVKKLDSDLRLQVRRLAIPREPKFLSCIGSGCAELLNGEGCEARSGMLVGGEIDEARCDPNDHSYAGCHGQIVSRLRVYRIDLEQNRPVRGDFRYGLCQDQLCGTDGKSVEESIAQLIAQLIGEQSLPSIVAAPRSTPEVEEQCTGAPNVALAAPPAPPPQPVNKPAADAKSAIFAYYTQYKHLNNTNDSGSPYPGKTQAETEAKEKAAHFIDGVSPPPGLQVVAPTVNTKYTLLPGEELVGNFARTNTLQGYLTSPPPGAAYDEFRHVPLERRMLIVLVLDHEIKSTSVFLIEPHKAMRQVAQPDACQAGSGDSAACIAAALQSAVPAAAESVSKEIASPAVAVNRGKPLGCMPYAERSCSAFSCPAAAVAVASSAPVTPESPPENPHRWTDRFLYVAMGLAALTAGVLTIADSANSPMTLSDDQGNSATITGLLRPAEWTAWGLTLALAVPTAISVIENGRAKQRDSLIIKPAPQPILPRCSISEEHL